MVTHTAYILLHFRVIRDRNPQTKKIIKRPVFSYAKVYSSASVTQAFNEKCFISELCHASGDSFEEAIDSVKRLCKQVPNYRWVLPWLTCQCLTSKKERWIHPKCEVHKHTNQGW